MSVIDKAKEHFSNQEITKIEVPEWGDENGPLYIYSKPLSLGEASKLYKLSQEDDLTMMAYVLIYKALDSEGNKLFNIGNKNDLLNNVDREVLMRVAQLIMGQEPIEETKKK
jgi:hypothetical protein|tara:strand:- start:297 stop:632 length:336 start_codon:yes stop_codon:yes gene_type:complete